jgi:eight-cysteine-cluster-containing protein
MAMQPKTKTTTLIGLLIVLVIIAGLLLALSNIAQQKRILSISSFEECALAGYPIMESYPEQCRTPDGRTFTNPEQDVQQVPNPPEGNIVANGCAVAGCSGTICTSVENAPNVVTTCEYRAEYACYQNASCEKQADGQCGWTQTAALQQCLQNLPPLE